MVYDDKIDIFLTVEFHSEADLGEGFVPVGRQFGLLCVKYNLPSCNVKCFVVAPKI